MPAGLLHGTQARTIAHRRGSQRATLLADWVTWLGMRLTVMALARDSHPIPPTRPHSQCDYCHVNSFIYKRIDYNPLISSFLDNFVSF